MQERKNAWGYLTADQAREVLRLQGVTVAEWARDRGFTPSLVHRVLKGQRASRDFGTGHRVKVELGMKPLIRSLDEAVIHATGRVS